MIKFVKIDDIKRLKFPLKKRWRRARCYEQGIKGVHMQIVGPPKSEIWNSVAADDVQRAKPLGPMAQTLQGPMADGFMRLDYQSLVLRVSLAIAMLQQFSTGDDVK